MNKKWSQPKKRQQAPSLRRIETATGAVEVEVPKASLLSTMVLLVGLFVTLTTVHGDKPDAIAAYMAWGVGISLCLSVIVDLRSGVRNLVRADVMALFSLYFLTLFEFLLPQSDINQILAPGSLQKGCEACVWGFAGLAVGRHFLSMGRSRFSELFERPVSPNFIVKLYWFCFILGYFYMLAAVNFNPLEMVSQFMEARFSQPWSRGKLGDWKALLGELGLLVYVIPPICGVVLAKRELYTKSQIAQVVFGCLFTLFYGFSSGTRNVFASYLVTFLIGYAFALPRNKTVQLVVVSGSVAVLLLVATRVMLEFRSMGLKYYLSGEMDDSLHKDQDFFVDYNLYVICRLTEIFPDRYKYLGWEVPYMALIRPIPRAMWAKKPEGLSISVEDALDASGLTLASSFVGEAYVSFGYKGVFFTGLVFGIIFGWWGCLASPRNSDFGILIYASGFFAAVISMRSMFVFTTAVLPTVAAIVAGQFFIRRARKRNASNRDRRARLA